MQMSMRVGRRSLCGETRRRMVTRGIADSFCMWSELVCSQVASIVVINECGTGISIVFDTVSHVSQN